MTDTDNMDIYLDEDMASPTSSYDPATPSTTATMTTTATDTTGKIKKKPGRKPNPASPQLRKIQNRAAQRAFRERKEKHIKELEVDYKKIKAERDTFFNENQQLSKENDVLKCENWYLKGIVLSLQLVCYKHKLHIPKHTPHIDEKALLMMAESAPQGIAAYLNVNNRNKSPHLKRKSNESSTDTPGFVFTDDGVETITKPSTYEEKEASRDGDSILASIRNASHSAKEASTTMMDHSANTFNNDNSNENNDDSSRHSSDMDDDNNDAFQPVLLTHDTTKNNMRAIQALRLRLRLQNALKREKITPYKIEPSLLQLTVPHDPRIDLIPTVHMRDRMIIFRDQYDLDDCLRLLVNEAVFHGGDPSQAINWELPTIFFEKYWFLTTNYTLERTSQKWRELKKMVASEASQTSNSNLSPSTSTLDNLNSQNPKNNNNNNNNNSMNENSSMEIGQELGQQQQVYYNTSQPSSTAHKSPLHTMAPFEGNNDGPVIQGSMNNSNKKDGTNNVNSSVYGVPQAIHNMANVHGTFDNNINKTPGNPTSSLSQPSRSPSSSNYTDINQQQIGAESQNTNSLQYSSDYPMPAQRFMQMSLPTGIDHLQQQMQQIQQPQQNQQQNQQQNWNQLYYFDFLGE